MVPVNEGNMTTIWPPSSIQTADDDIKRKALEDALKCDGDVMGRKDDTLKPKAGVVIQDFSHALMAISNLGTFGIFKYGPSNWLHVDDGISRYTDAMSRHFLLEKIEKIDPETHMLHAVSTAWNALARLELIIREQNRLKDGE